MNRISRRGFLKSAALAGGALGFPSIVPSSVLGAGGKTPPSEKVNVALIACGGRSGYGIMYKRYDKSVVIGVSDPIKSRRLERKAQFDNCADYADFREVLANKDVDAVHIATPDHWHVPIALLAARAGKDMYTEKPLGISIAHDLAAREIVDKHHRIFQYGAQQRSMKPVRMGIDLVLNGHIGEVKQAYVWAPQGQAGGTLAETPVPDGLDYDMWLGPAPKAPYCEDRCFGKGQRKGVYHIYDYAIGFLAGWGAHSADMFQWWLDNAGIPNMPTSCEAKGDAAEVGPVQHAAPLGRALRIPERAENAIHGRLDGRQTQVARGHQGRHGALFVGEKGWVRVVRGGWGFSDDQIRRKAPDPGPKRLKVSVDQIQNFIDCVLSKEEPVDNLHSAVRSDIVCHLVDISARTGRKLAWDDKKETIVGDAEAQKMASRDLRAPWTL